ncbi:MAG: Glu-tRNA(Gln) amidotransferase subunit GatE [Thermoprotei archaeon]
MIDYNSIGLKVGLEVHQQLDTRHKLFCSCPTELSERESTRFHRYLRAVRSELGEVDPAALFEMKRGRSYIYLCDNNNTCLVEMDEEPPHSINEEALQIALTFALMVNSIPVDEVHVMRKEVIDGSNTSGFQRTAVIALGGFVRDGNEIISIQTISLEEDAARKTDEKSSLVYYRLDRMGIPLIEVSTGPDIHSPEQAERVALKIGRLLRSTGKVKRGLGTIRQDLNISIRNGAKTEIKGIQELELIGKVVEYEVLRQLNLLKLKDELNKRVRKDSLAFEPVDVTKVFESTNSKVLRKYIDNNEKIYALKLKNFSGFLGFELQTNRRFGTELSDYAKFWGGVTGIIHTDELPSYGITLDEVKRLREFMKAEEGDAIIITGGPEENCIEGLKAVYQRILQAFVMIPEETRVARPDGTTSYARPRPGSARMYPETDVPPIVITKELLDVLQISLPKTLEEKVKELMELHKLNKELAISIADSDYYELYMEAVKLGVPSTIAASMLTQTLKSLKREGVPIENLTERVLREVFKKLSKGELVKEALPDILAWLARNPSSSIEDSLKVLNLTPLTEVDVGRLIDSLIEKYRGTVKIEFLSNVVMKELMKQIRGRFDGGIAKKIIDEKIRRMRENNF